ncbi:hypothetical protein ES708_14671 [subsurface metagenome]
MKGSFLIFKGGRLCLVEIGLPVMQGSGVTEKEYLLQVETAPYLQTEEEDLILTVDPTYAEKKGSILVRVFGKIGDPLLVDEIEVAYIMIA